MATLTGFIKRMDPVTKAEQEVTDIWIGTRAAEFGTKMTDWDGLSAEFVVDSHVTVEYEEKPGKYRGKTILYRNLKSIQAVGEAPKAEEDGSPFPPETHPEAPKQGAAPPSSGPVASPAPPSPGAKAKSEPHQDSREASIERQVCLKEAWETVRYLMQVDKLSPGDDKAIYERLAAYLHMGLTAMREA